MANSAAGPDGAEDVDELAISWREDAKCADSVASLTSLGNKPWISFKRDWDEGFLEEELVGRSIVTVERSQNMRITKVTSSGHELEEHRLQSLHKHLSQSMVLERHFWNFYFPAPYLVYNLRSLLLLLLEPPRKVSTQGKQK